MSNFTKYAAIFLFATLVAGLLGTWLGADLKFPDNADGMAAFWSRFQVLFVLSVLIERSVEIYLKATEQNGAEFYDADNRITVKTRDATQPAMIAALVLSVLVAAIGARIISPLVTLDGNVDKWKSIVWNGVDIMVSAGLMAGGSDLFHKVAELITSGLDRLKSNVKGQSRGGQVQQVDPGTYRSILALRATPTAASKSYSISISRPKGANVSEGTLSFIDSTFAITAKCWWDINNRIDAGTYTKCSKTHMASLGYKAVYLPDAVSKVTGAKEIFIHHGAGPENSLGCIAVETAQFDKLWDRLGLEEGFNVTVVVSDV